MCLVASIAWRRYWPPVAISFKAPRCALLGKSRWKMGLRCAYGGFDTFLIIGGRPGLMSQAPPGSLVHACPAQVRPSDDVVTSPKPSLSHEHLRLWVRAPGQSRAGFREIRCSLAVFEKEITNWWACSGLGLGPTHADAGRWACAAEIVVGHDFRSYSAGSSTALVSAWWRRDARFTTSASVNARWSIFAKFALDIPCVAKGGGGWPRLPQRQTAGRGVKMGSAGPLTVRAGRDGPASRQSCSRRSSLRPRRRRRLTCSSNISRARYIADLHRTGRSSSAGSRWWRACGNGTAGAFAPARCSRRIGCEGWCRLDCEASKPARFSSTRGLQSPIPKTWRCAARSAMAVLEA